MIFYWKRRFKGYILTHWKFLRRINEQEKVKRNNNIWSLSYYLWSIRCIALLLGPIRTETTIEYWIPSLLGIAFLFCGIGLLMLKEWARIFILIFASYGIVKSTYLLAHYVLTGKTLSILETIYYGTGITHFGLCMKVFNILWFFSFIIFLTNSKVKEHFKS